MKPSFLEIEFKVPGGSAIENMKLSGKDKPHIYVKIRDTGVLVFTVEQLAFIVSTIAHIQDLITQFFGDRAITADSINEALLKGTLAIGQNGQPVEANDIDGPPGRCMYRDETEEVVRPFYYTNCYDCVGCGGLSGIEANLVRQGNKIKAIKDYKDRNVNEGNALGIAEARGKVNTWKDIFKGAVLRYFPDYEFEWQQ